jgi:hypothetical protein
MFGLYMIFLQDGFIKQTYRHTDHILYICVLFWHVIHFCTPMDLWNENKFCSLPFFSIHKLTRKLWVNTVNSLITFLLLNCYYILWDVRFSWWLQRSLPSGTWHYVGPSDTEQFLRGICCLHHQDPSDSNLQHFFTKKLLWTYLTTLIFCVSLSHFQTAMTLKFKSHGSLYWIHVNRFFYCSESL